MFRDACAADSEVGLQPKEESAVNDLIDRLEDIGHRQIPRPLDNAHIFGNFNVAFSSTQRTSEQNGQPAGGNFRSKPGRLFFQTRELCQSIFKPDLATNKVGFAILGFISGSVGLRGTFTPEGDNKDTVKVSFEPPRVSLPGGISLAVGPTSSVVLSTTYLDERVRLGKGGRGSRFVFTRGGACEHAGMEDIGTARTTASGYAILLSLTAAFFAAAYSLYCGGTLLSKLLAAAPALLGVAITFALVRNAQFNK
ncbi:hypothetical protein ABBQ38_005152 [Trebouxia sp. C0009 RCD-2024]